jgi:toxin-antitoxin system PIN domain toxin
MILPDFNVLIFAFRRDTPEHALCKEWLTNVVAGEAKFALSPLALSAVVRITTNGRIFRMPSELNEAFSFCDVLLSQPHCEIIEPGERHWSIFRRLCIVSGIRGARVSDAWYAALAIESGCEWITLDRNFARFPGLKWRLPAI